MSVPTLGPAAVNAMFLPNCKGIMKRDNHRRAKVTTFTVVSAAHFVCKMTHHLCKQKASRIRLPLWGKSGSKCAFMLFKYNDDFEQSFGLRSGFGVVP